MSKQQKTFGIEIVEKNDDGGQIIINTDSVDRDRDRVFPAGANVADYLRNPVVQFGHNYRDPWATVGRTDTLEVSENAINARFTLRPAANEHDPQNIVRLLWLGEWIRTASIGFMPGILPTETAENEFGGIDFLKWDLLEWSLVPIPANQDALRQAVKSMAQPGRTTIYDVIDHWPVTVNDDQTLRYSPERDEPDTITTFAGDRRKLYVVSMPVDVQLTTQSVTVSTADDKGVIPYRRTPLAPKDQSWDGPGQIRQAEVDDLRVMCTWFDSENADVKSAYKLPHHLAAGEHSTVWRGVTAAMGALLGARGGVNIPDTDRRGVYNHLARHYRDFDEEPPEFRAYEMNEFRALFPELFDDPTPDDVNGRDAGDMPTQPTDNEPNNDTTPDNEPNNDDTRTGDALDLTLAQLAETLKNLSEIL